MNRLVWQLPEANLSFVRSTALDIADRVGFVGMPPIGTSREAYVTVTLTAHNLYYFWAQTPVSTPALSIFDSEGYLLLSHDSDDIWPGSDPVGVDSLVYFTPAETGTYYLRVNYGSFPLATGFLVEGWEDVDGDFANALTQPTASVAILAWQPPFAEGTGGATRHSFTVTRFGNLSTAQSVSWFAEGNGDRPADAADFVGGVMPGGVIVFDAGQSTATITIDVLGDSLPEFAETFLVRLVDPSRGLRIERSAGVAGVTIHDDDGGATLEAASLVATEGTGTGGTFTFTVRANAPQTGQHEVRWQVDTAGLASPVTAQDFAGGILPFGTLVFGPGQTSQTVTLTFAGDTTVEAIERFRISLQGVSPELPPRGTTSLVVELRDDDTNLVSIAAPADSAWEGNGEGATLTFVVTRSVPTAAQVVDWLAYGLEAADFADGVIPSGRLDFAAGEASKTITIRLNGDTLPERDEELTVSLGIPFGPANYLNQRATVTIRDDEHAVRLLWSDAAQEGDADGTLVTFFLQRGGDVTNAATVAWRAERQTEGVLRSADAADFAGGAWPGGIATFAAGSRFTSITMAIQDDAIPEADEWFTVRLSDPSPGLIIDPVAGTWDGIIRTDETFIIDNATAPLPHLEGDDGPTTLVIPLYRWGDATGTDTLTWAVSTDLPGHAGAVATAARFAGGVLPSGQVTFAAGQTRQDIILSIASDDVIGPEFAAFRLVLTPSRPGLGAADDIIRVIQDNDALIAIQPNWVQRAEGDDGITPFAFTVTRSGATQGSSTVAWSISTTPGATVTAEDFADGVLPSGVLTFAPGDTSATITVGVRGDRQAEATERFFVTLGEAGNGVLLGNTIGRGAILPDDTTVSIASLLATRPEGNSGTTPFTFAVTRAGLTDAAQSVEWSVIGSGTRRATESDFAGGVMPTGRVEFAAGETRKNITINVAGDTRTEFDEGFAVQLANPTAGLMIDQAQAFGTIIRDEMRFGITADATEVVEGTGGITPVTFTVTRSGYTGAPKVVDWAVVSTGPTRTVAGDFAPVSLPRGAVRFEIGEETKTITVNLAADRLGEADETFTLRLGGRGEGVTLNPAAATVTIRDDDTSVAIAPLLATRAEGDGGTTPFTFAVTRSGLLDATHSVAWSVLPQGNARVSAADFAGGVLPSGVIIFDPGQASAIITVEVLGDQAMEPAEDFLVRLSAPSPDLFISRMNANGRILDDDAPGAMSLAAPDWVL